MEDALPLKLPGTRHMAITAAERAITAPTWFTTTRDDGGDGVGDTVSD